MKKTLLLSVAASALIMAGGDIAPVEPAVAAPAASGWDFSGTAKFYYQTIGLDEANIDLFDRDLSSANAGLQLRAMNNDLFAGIGMGVELSGLATLDLEAGAIGLVNYPAQFPQDGQLTGGWISQAYLTYGFGNTSIKVGRQELPKALSPFAYSEDWNVFKNTFDAALVVNTDLPDTTVVLAWVKRANYTYAPVIADNMSSSIDVNYGTGMNSFMALNGNDGVGMITVQNKSIENVQLTGTYYDISGNYIWWADAQITLGDYTLGLQGGEVEDGLTAYGAKIATAFSGVNVALAYARVEDGSDMSNVGGTTSALYTETAGDQLLTGWDIRWSDIDIVTLSASTEAFGGTVSAAYSHRDGDYANPYQEFDLAYSTNITDALGVTAAYVHADLGDAEDHLSIGGFSLDVVRVVATYNF